MSTELSVIYHGSKGEQFRIRSKYYGP